MARLAFLCVVILAAPLLAHAEDVALVAKGVERGKEYRFSVAADGTVTISPLQTVVVTGTPPPTNPPSDPPSTPDTPLKVAVRKLTREAIDRGGMPLTAAKLATLYELVSGGCLDGSVRPDLASSLIVSATNEVLKDAADKDAWQPWREGLSPELSKVAGIGTDKAATAAALKEVSDGVKQAINQQVEPGVLDNIPWQKLIELLKPLIQKLLLDLLNDLINGLPK